MPTTTIAEANQVVPCKPTSPHLKFSKFNMGVYIPNFIILPIPSNTVQNVYLACGGIRGACPSYFILHTSSPNPLAVHAREPHPPTIGY
eukprot:2197689-Amphidinium_carterae.1